MARGSPRHLVSAVGTAAGLLRRRWAAVLVAMLCVQGALIWTLPLLVALVRWTLRLLGIEGANVYTLGTVVTSPLALLVVVVVAVVATVFVLAEMTLFAIIAHLALDDEPVTFRSVLRRTRATLRTALRRQGLLLIPYLTVLLPISQVGFSSVLTEHIALPRFISGELLKTTSGTVLYVVVMGAIMYTALRLLLFPAVLAGGEVSVLEAMRRSLRLTTWRTLLGIGAVMVTTLVAAFLVLLPLGGIGLVPVALAQSYAVSGAVLGLLDLARFLVAGTAAAFLAFFLVAHLRLAEEQPVAVTAGAPASRPTRSASLVLVLLALLLATPGVVTAAETAGRTAQSSPEIIGHRGYPARAVENSLEGLHAAADAGADVVETDIQETGDGGLIVMHDVDLERMTGDGRSVHELGEAELTSLTLRQDGRTARIPTLEEYVRTADARGVRLLVELKPHGHEQPGFARRVAEEMDRLDPDRTHMIQSLDRGLIEEITALAPQRPTAYVVGFQLGGLPATSTDAVAIENWSYHERMLGQAHAQGRDLYLWTVNDPGPLSHRLAGGADGVITDEVGRAAETRERLSSGPVMLYLELARGLVTVE